MAKNDNGMMTILWIALALGALVSVFSSNNSSPPAKFEIDSSTPEHRYVKERFKLEGYSDADSKKAADAIIKFHNAQNK